MPQQPKQVREIKVVSTKRGSVNVTKVTTLASSGDVLDPLSAMAMDPLSYPLSAMSVGTANQPPPPPTSSSSKGGTDKNATSSSSGASSSASPSSSSSATDFGLSWELKKSQIRNDYKVVGNITLSGSSVRDFAGSGVEDGSGKRQVDLYSQRLANLERKQMNEDTVEMSQKECESHINKLYRDLDCSWTSDFVFKRLNTISPNLSNFSVTITNIDG